MCPQLQDYPSRRELCSTVYHLQSFSVSYLFGVAVLFMSRYFEISEEYKDWALVARYFSSIVCLRDLRDDTPSLFTGYLLVISQ